MRTEFNKVQGLFDASTGNSFSLSHAKPSLRSAGSIAIAGGASFTNGESFTLTDALGQSVTFKVDTTVNLIDGSVDADGNVVLGTDGTGADAAQIDDLVALINVVSSFDQSAQNGAPAGQKDLKLDIFAVDDGTTCSLFQQTNGASGNTKILTFNAAGAAAALTNCTVTDFSGGKDAGTAETATGIHFLLEEVSIDQTVLGDAGDLNTNAVAVQLSHKIPANSAILKASFILSAADDEVDLNNSGDYKLAINSASLDPGDAKGNGATDIAAEIATSRSDVGTTTSSLDLAVANKQFLQIYSSAAANANNAETGTVKFLVAIEYAGMGEPIKI